MSINDIYSYGDRKCMGCGLVIYTAPSIIIGECPLEMQIDIGVCDLGHTYCKACKKQFPKDTDAYPLCPCGRPLGSYAGLKSPPTEEHRIYKNTDSFFYTIGKRTCFSCDKPFYTESVQVLRDIPDDNKTHYYACGAEHITCPTCNTMKGGALTCPTKGCGLPLERYLASNTPIYDWQEEAKEPDSFEEVRYFIFRGRGSIDRVEDGYTYKVANGTDDEEIEQELNTWLEFASHRSGNKYMVVGKSFDGGGSFVPCRIPFSRQKEMDKESFDGILSVLDLEFETDFVRLRDRVLTSLLEAPSPRLLSLSDENLDAAFGKLIVHAQNTIHSRGLDESLLQNPFLLAEEVFESGKQWEDAEFVHAVVHDYFIMKDFGHIQPYLPALRYKCGFCSAERGNYDRAYRYLTWSREILDWNADDNFRWLHSRVYADIAVHHMRLRQWDEAMASYTEAFDWAEEHEYQALALYHISEIHRHLNKPDKAFIAIEEAHRLCGNADISNETKALVETAYALLKTTLEGGDPSIQALSEVVDNVGGEKGFMPVELHQILKGAADCYISWLKEDDLPIDEYLQTVSENIDALLKTLSGKLPAERVKIILALLPALGELKRYDLFSQILDYGLHTAASKKMRAEWLKLKRMEFRLRSIRREVPSVLKDYAELTEEVERLLPLNERLAFYTEFVEAYGRAEELDSTLFDILRKMREGYFLERNSMPTMEGRIMVRALHQRYLETVIVTLAHFLLTTGEDRDPLLTALTGFLELAKGYSLRDYIGGFGHFEYRKSLDEHDEYLKCKHRLYDTLESFQDIKIPLQDLKTIEVSLRAKHYQGFAVEDETFNLPMEDDTAVIHYFFIRECSVQPFGIAVVYYRGLAAIAPIPSDGEFSRMLDLWRSRRFKATADAERLYEMLIAGPLQAFVLSHPGLFAGQGIGKKITRIGIIPDGILEEVPFEALYTEAKTGGRFIDKYESFYLSSLAQYRKAENRTIKGVWYGFGNPIHAFRKEEGIPLENLPCTEDEIGAIATQLAPLCRTEILLGADNTKTKFLEIIRTTGNHSVFHLAVHGYGDHTVPENSSIFFSTHTLDGDRIEARLSFREILELDLREVGLVVLSACQTAVGKKMSGEGAMALSWAFKAAGAKSVIATRWLVGDKAAQIIMSAFYRYMLENGDVSLSLALAEREYILAHPNASAYQWGAFLVYL